MNHNMYKTDNNNDFKIRITKINNNTYIAKFENNIHLPYNYSVGNSSADVTSYNGQGAMLYICAVILIYGFSIVFMIGSSVKKSMTSHQGLSKYMQDLHKLRMIERRQSKFRTRLAMSGKSRNYIGSRRVVFGASGKSIESNIDKLSTADQNTGSLLSLDIEIPMTPRQRPHLERSLTVDYDFPRPGKSMERQLSLATQPEDMCELGNVLVHSDTDSVFSSSNASLFEPVKSPRMIEKYGHKSPSTSITLQTLVEMNELEEP